MNDFTKEELKKLKSGLTGWMELSGVAVQPLIEKLQSMIDNYCEPICDHELQLCRCFYGVDEHTYRCKKCLKSHEEVINDDYQ